MVSVTEESQQTDNDSEFLFTWLTQIIEERNRNSQSRAQNVQDFCSVWQELTPSQHEQLFEPDNAFTKNLTTQISCWIKEIIADGDRKSFTSIESAIGRKYLFEVAKVKCERGVTLTDYVAKLVAKLEHQHNTCIEHSQPPDKKETPPVVMDYANFYTNVLMMDHRMKCGGKSMSAAQ